MVRKTRKSFTLLLSILVSLLLSTFNFFECSAGENINPKPVWLVVTRPMFIDSLKPLAEKRKSEGFETIISTKTVSEAISSASQKPAYLLLVGDCQRNMDTEPWYIPTRMCQTYRWQQTQEKEYASDSLWGDLNNDMIPDIPVGRLPVRTKEELQLLVGKILDYEKRPPSLNDLRLPIYTGSADYQPILDSMTTEFLLGIIKKNAAEWLRPWILAANQTHPLCGWPEEQGEIFTKQIKEGGLMTVLMGHGWTDYFYGMEFNGKRLNYTAEQAAGFLAKGEPAPPLVIFACYCGNFTALQNCLAESFLFMPAGPVATIGATTVSHPMTNYFSGLCLLSKPGHTSQDEKRLGTLWLDAQKDAMKARDFIMETLLLNVEGKLEDKIDADKLRREHILIYALLGDPATLLHLPQPLECKIEKDGDNWYWHVEKPKGALKLYVEIRPAGQSMPRIQLPLQKDSARKNLQLANDTFAFNTIIELSSDKKWEGSINAPGILRLVALTQNNIYVTAQKIEPK